jgi:hypothetical protein
MEVPGVDGTGNLRQSSGCIRRGGGLAVFPGSLGRVGGRCGRPQYPR